MAFTWKTFNIYEEVYSTDLKLIRNNVDWLMDNSICNAVNNSVNSSVQTTNRPSCSSCYAVQSHN